jgi:hypothetical protein
MSDLKRSATENMSTENDVDNEIANMATRSLAERPSLCRSTGLSLLAHRLEVASGRAMRSYSRCVGIVGSTCA